MIDLDEKVEIVGLDYTHGHGWDNYPLDSVFVRSEQRTVIEVVRRINLGRYDLNPDFQRDFVWPIEKQSRLIESCLMRLPLPVFYVAEAKDGRIIVVDGLQRLNTMKRFLANEFALDLPNADVSKSRKDYPLNGKLFRELEFFLQERIEDTQLILYIIDVNAPERAKLDIFERVNGGVPLTRQQMRNCLYNGPATRWLKETAELDSFKNIIGNALNVKNMQDREVINRFCGFKLIGLDSYDKCEGNVDLFMAKTLEYMNQLSSAELDDLRKSFDDSMNNNMMLFGKHAFRKSIRDLTGYRTVLNISLFDVCAVVLSEISTELVKGHAEAIKNSFADLLLHHDFLKTITSATTNKKNVRDKFEMMRKSLQDAIPC
ncbi:MAG: DUF262 domain-containing protein [Magnetococcales bacterium]|nr:DUF262 domain-containing protein [Magnetococcales bacterium]